MTVLTSEVDTTSETFRTNLEVQSAAVAALDEQLALVAAGGGERYVTRHHQRGRIQPEEPPHLFFQVRFVCCVAS